MSDTFRADMATLVQQAGERVDLFVRYCVAGLAGDIIERSPVDTGRFKGNWQYGVNGVNMNTDSPVDPGGEGASQRILEGLESFEIGQTLYVTNSLPYAHRLEYGSWSKQAPQGMVRLAVASFQARVASAAERVRSES